MKTQFLNVPVKYWTVFFSLGISFLLLVSCSDDNEPPITKPGSFVSLQQSGEYSKSLLSMTAQMLGISISPQYDVNLYKVEYYTNLPDRAPLLCSGYLCIPVTGEALNGIVGWQHATVFSETERKIELGAMAAAASLGYIVVGNDYIGLGASESEPQAYHLATYASADGIALLEATADYVKSKNIQTSDILQLVGYSQGAYNAVAIQRAWENNNYDFFELKNVYAGAGALNLSDMAKRVFSEEHYEGAPFFPPFIRANNFYYDMKLDYSKIYQPAFGKKIDDYYNGTMNMDAIRKQVPDTLKNIFTPSFIDDMRMGNGSFYAALQRNNLTDFSPKAALYIFHSKGDEIIPYSIGREAAEYYTSAGGNAYQMNGGDDANHQAAYYTFLSMILSYMIR